MTGGRGGYDPGMNRFRRVLQVVNVTSLGLWLGAMVMTGVAAAVTFPTVKKLAPTLASHASYTGDHWLIVAGRVAAKIFAINDVIQIVCAFLATATLGMIVIPRMRDGRSVPLGLRVATQAVALAIACYYLFVLSPEMIANLTNYWKAAEVGDNARAAAFQAAFDADHPTASRIMGATAIAVLASLIAAAWPETVRGDAGGAARTNGGTDA